MHKIFRQGNMKQNKNGTIDNEVAIDCDITVACT